MTRHIFEFDDVHIAYRSDGCAILTIIAKTQEKGFKIKEQIFENQALIQTVEDVLDVAGNCEVCKMVSKKMKEYE